MNDYKFYDTSSLLLKTDSLFIDKEPFAISSITLEELENIKTSNHKDAEIKYKARKLLHLLDEHSGEYDIHIFKEQMLNPIIEKDLTITNDMKILATAFNYDNNIHPDETIFVTNDLALKAIANLFFGDGVIESVKEEEDNYTGYIDIQMTDNEMEYFYSNLQKNTLNALINQYVIIRDKTNGVIDRRVWTGTEYRNLIYENFKSNQLGVIKPMTNDPLQQCVADSLCRNKITLIKGKPGSGKSILSLGFLFQQLERHKIEKIIIFCNTIAVRGAARLGFYPGSREEKLLDSQIGNFLISKLGDRVEVERLINDGKLLLLPMADIRGFDTTGMNAGVYITEAQNLDIPLMKLALQRIGDDSICIIDGDEKTQVDDILFEGANNGMRRASKIFRGQEFYGEIELNKVHRSRIGEIADRM